MLAGDIAILDDDEGPGTADVDGLRRFIEGKVLPWFDGRREEISRRPLLRDQAFGESLDPEKLEKLPCIMQRAENSGSGCGVFG